MLVRILLKIVLFFKNKFVKANTFDVKTMS